MEKEIHLPQPNKEGKLSTQETLFRRRSVRDFKDEPLTLEEASQILWAAQGISGSGGRTAPSAGALYPLEVYLVVRSVKNLKPGVYKYRPQENKLTTEGCHSEQAERPKNLPQHDVSSELAKAALGQLFISQAPVNLVITAIYSRTTGKYGQRGARYVHLEAGHVAQNVYLQAESLGLGTVTIGAFNDEEVKGILNLPKEEIPLYIMPVGKK